MIEYNNAPPKWANVGTEPLETEKQSGYAVKDKVPADYLNYHLNRTGECIEELQNKLSNEDTERKNADTALQMAINNEAVARAEAVGGITKESLGLDKVNNTPDSEKNVAFASEANEARKVEYPLTVRFKGGSTEGTDMWTYNGSTSRSINITPDKIGAAKNDLSNVDDEVFKEKVESTVTTGTPIVAATSTDGETYAATVDGVTELYNGLEITIIPNMTSTKAAPQFNLNELGAKNLRLKIDGYNSGNSGTMAAFAGWLGQDTPITIRYMSKFDNWQTVDFSRPSASGLYGTIKTTQGGTGISKDTGVTAGNFLVGNGADAMVEKTPEEVLSLIGAATTFTKTVSVNTSWSVNSGGIGYYKAVAVSDITSSDNPIVDVLLGNDYEANKLYLKAWECISRIRTENGQITLFAYDKAPETAFNIQLKVVR